MLSGTEDYVLFCSSNFSVFVFWFSKVLLIKLEQTKPWDFCVLSRPENTLTSESSCFTFFPSDQASNLPVGFFFCANLLSFSRISNS